MLPASNRGVGMNLGFPDVCLTPAGPAVVPIPYPNLAMNVQAMPFSVIVMITMMNALNMASKIRGTSGDEAGVAHPMIKQMGAYTMGNPIVFIEKMPGICLLCPTTGNNMNNPLGAVLVPSVTVVMYTRRAEGAEGGEGGEGAGGRAMAVEELRGLSEAPSPPVRGALLQGGIGWITIDLFTFDVPSLVHHEMRRLEAEGMKALILDLRGNPGGEVDAFIRLADDFLPLGAVIVKITDADGDEMVYRARQGSPCELPLVVLVDRDTASAGELFAGCLKVNRRAVVVGETTHGKGVAQAIVPGEDGRGAVYATVASCVLDGDAPVQGVGVVPDVAVRRGGAGDAGDAGVEAARRLALGMLTGGSDRTCAAAPGATRGGAAA